ncbi:hypothetical protein OBBRIDRAFT_581755 [Obba rivulosa]|uniref:Uncharacterized protein n=1 Tax=Obba rivulosa TaxID=1052685 RepID=A0A8E2DJR4_9APHY|nr:hypothetical protein OBBRIDRAFT_581755 [Obba rivulosa]
MPRFIPRLLKHLEKSPPQSTPYVFRTKQPQPRLKIQKPPPECPPLSPEGRTQSIVMDSLNPILKIGKYKRRKKLSPRVLVSKWRHKMPQTVGSIEQHRAMTEEERSYWSNPYLRMLASPIRQCMATERYLPRDFLIPMKLRKLPGPRTAKDMAIALPCNLEHPSFNPRGPGVASYIVCWKDAVAEPMKQGKTFRMPFQVHSLFAQQVAHLLRVRVLQELHVLAARLERNPRDSHQVPVIRRLTRAEWKAVKSSGTIPHEDAVAVLVVPPLNKNPKTQTRPEPSMSTAPTEEPGISSNLPPLPPLSQLYPTTSEQLLPEDQDDILDVVPGAKTPLYNGVSMFPSPSQRAALHASLSRILQIYRAARFKEQQKQASRGHTVSASASTDIPEPEQDQISSTKVRGDQKGSHAFLICSNAATVLRADVAPLAIALWRIRMWEGAGWLDSQTAAGPWQLDERPIDFDSL